MGGAPRFIMECKSASPSLGMIREQYHPGDLARIYSRLAAGISVLCEPDRFRGDYDHLTTVASSTHLPVLCKDFIIDEAQVYAARYFGADAILLMLSILDDATYRQLAGLADRLGLDVLTEAISAEEMARARALGAKIVGINHRNLHDLSIDLTRSAELNRLAPENAVVIAESGIRDNATVRRLVDAADAGDEPGGRRCSWSSSRFAGGRSTTERHQRVPGRLPADEPAGRGSRGQKPRLRG